MRRGWLCMVSWAGPTFSPVDVLGETPKRIRVRLRRRTHVGRAWRLRGTVLLVPKHAVTWGTP